LLNHPALSFPTRPLQPTSITVHRQNLQSERERQRQKTDPVSLYHHYKQDYWSKDPFLNRLEHPETISTKQRMFGGMGYFVATGGKQVPVRRAPTKIQTTAWGRKSTT
jgi:hypothetical protein